MAKQDAFVRYTIRVPADLYADLQKAAGMKSLNAEIVARLKDSITAEKALASGEPTMADIADELMRQVKSLTRDLAFEKVARAEMMADVRRLAERLIGDADSKPDAVLSPEKRRK